MRNKQIFSNSPFDLILAALMSLLLLAHPSQAAGGKASFTDNGNGTVTDNKTGLMWQKDDDAQERNWDDSMTYCRSLPLAGKSDWRLPTKDELRSSRENFARKSKQAEEENKNTGYWSSTTYTSPVIGAYFLSFKQGLLGDYKNVEYYAQCVRTDKSTLAPLSPADRSAFADNRDATVTDNKTGLIWQKDDDNTERSWGDAASYCTGLSVAGHSEWRLPGKDQLGSLWQNAGSKTGIRKSFFPGMKSGQYWSSTGADHPTDFAWFVNFDDGLANTWPKGQAYLVRCVRQGQ